MRTIIVSCVLFLPALLLAQDRAPLSSSEESSSENTLLSSRDVIDPVAGLSAAQLVERALQHNPDLLAARLEVDVKRGQLVQARLHANPSFNLEQMIEPAGKDNRFTAGAAIPLELFGRVARRAGVASEGLTVQQFLAADRERLIAASVKSAYHNTLAAVRNLQFTEDLLALNRQNATLIRARADEGSAARLDAGIALVEANRIDTVRAQDAARVAVLLYQLRTLIGMNPEEPLLLKPYPEEPLKPIGREQALATALATRSDLRAAKAEERMIEAQLREAETGARPDASLGASYVRSDSGFALSGIDPAGNLRPIRQVFNYVTFGVNISAPLRNRNQGTLLANSAAMSAAHQRTVYLDLTIRNEIAAVYAAYAAAARNVKIYKSSVRDLAADNLDVVRKAYQLGRNTILDVISEQRRYIEIETGYTEVINQYAQALVEMERVIGASPIAQEVQHVKP
jgi:outer membrane protein, heavy metal efflux system